MTQGGLVQYKIKGCLGLSSWLRCSWLLIDRFQPEIVLQEICFCDNFWVACHCHILPQTYKSGPSMMQHERNTQTPVFLVLRHPWISNHLPYTGFPPVLRFPNCCQPTRRLKDITTDIVPRCLFFLNKEVWTEFKGTHMIGFKSTSIRAYQVRRRDLALNQSQKSGNLEIKWNEYANLDGYHLWLSEVFFLGRIPATLSYTFLSELAGLSVFTESFLWHVTSPASQFQGHPMYQGWNKN